MIHRAPWLLAGICGAFAACAADDYGVQPPAVTHAEIIYGEDDRTEPSDVGTAWIPSTHRAIALVEREATISPPLDEDDGGLDDDGGVDPPSSAPKLMSVSERFSLCSDERFASQPSLPGCSGVALAPDVVLTAGHCFDETDGCERYRYAAGYRLDTLGRLEEPVWLDCAEVLLREVGMRSNGDVVDYALIRLEQPIPRVPEAAPDIGTIEVGQVVTTVGFPLGLPLKITTAGEVVSTDSTSFGVWSDTYHGSSGSAVYDEHGALVGIIAQGQLDLEWDPIARCQRTRVEMAPSVAAAERAIAASVLLARACHRKPKLEFCAAPTSDTPASSDGGTQPLPMDQPHVSIPSDTVESFEDEGVETVSQSRSRTRGCSTIEPRSPITTFSVTWLLVLIVVLLPIRHKRRLARMSLLVWTNRQLRARKFFPP